MIKFIYTVYDSAANLYMQPFPAISEGQAIRDFGDGVKRKDSTLGTHPEDFSLWVIGTFDDDTGFLDPFPPKRVITALEIVNKTELSQDQIEDLLKKPDPDLKEKLEILN